MHYFLFGKGVISEFSYSLDNREDTNLTLYELVSLPKWCWTFSKFLALQILLRGRPSSIVLSPSLCLMLDELDNPN